MGGEKKGIILKTVKGSKTRPLSARAKNSLFGILAPHLCGAHFFDFFAGSGAVGIEALSRGAEGADFYEKDDACISIIRQNLKKCGFLKRASVHRTDVLKVITSVKVSGENPSIVFLGPPYDSGLAHASLVSLGKYDPFPGSVLIIAQVRKNNLLEPQYGHFNLVRDECYGDMRLGFFERIPQSY